MIPLIFYFVIIFLIIIYGYIYIGITQDTIEKNYQAKLKRMKEQKENCFLKECDETYYFSKSKDQN